MPFLTGRHLPRRTFLRGMGATVALPLLDAMMPAGRRAAGAATGPTRLICIEEVHGCAGGHEWGAEQLLFAPATVGRDFEIAPESLLQPLVPYREYLTIVSNTDCRMAEPFQTAEIGADHMRSTCVFLTQAHPKQTQGSGVYVGTSLDQVHARRYGQDTVLPSLELCIEGIDQGGGCAYDYHCAYADALSWASPSEPLPNLRDPRVVFERLFGAGDGARDRIARRRTNASILDWVVGEVARAKRELGAVDRVAMDDYLENIREIERRIAIVETHNTSGDPRALPEAPAGVPDSFQQHMHLMFDLQVVALQADLTRVTTLKTGRDLQNRTHPECGVNKSHHGASHHGNNHEAILDFNTIGRYRLGMVTHLLDKLKTVTDGGRPLIDGTAVVWGSPMGDPNRHNHRKCPLLLLGRANGFLEGDLHLKAPDGTPMANAFVGLMHGIGHDDLEGFGDSTGELPLRFPGGAAAATSSSPR